MRRLRLRIGAAPALVCLALAGPAAHATSQGPVADGPYVGTLPCADCAGIRTSLTLYTMGQGGKIEVNAIMLGLALALKATAAGLLVAIPAIMFYNALLRKVEVLTARWQAVQDGKTA